MPDENPPQKMNESGGALRSFLMGPDNYPLAYYNMPKAACTTIKNILFYIQHGSWLPTPILIHKEMKKGALLRKSEFATHRAKNLARTPYTNFTFVRDPGRRVYSAFVEKIWDDGPYAFPTIRKHLAKKYGYGLPFLTDARDFDPKDVSVAFKIFLRFVAENLAGNSPFPPNPHWASQYQRVRQLPPQDTLNFIGRVETFARDMTIVLNRGGWEDTSIISKRFNEGPSAPCEFASILDDETAAMITELFRQDYLDFGYAPPLS